MPWIELAPPSELALDFELLKQNLRVTTSDEDTLLTFYAEAAIDLFERKTDQRLISRTFRLDRPDFPAQDDECGIELPVAPVSAVTHVKYYDTARALETWNSDEYLLDTLSHYPRVRVAPNEVYPVAQPDRHDAVQVTFTAGYGATHASVPKGIQWALMLLASEMFTKRLPVDKVPEGMERVVGVYKLWRA